ncbi:MAG: hypothetical protein AB8H79_13245 [Myxococcota bacterium]
MGPIARDMNALHAIEGRFAGTEGERAMLHAVRQRMPEEGWLVRVEGLVAHNRPDWVVVGHVVLLIVVGLVGAFYPGWVVPLAALLTASLLGEATGRFVLLRRLVVKAASYNLVAKEQRPQAKGSVVITCNLDVSRWARTRRSGLRLGERAFQAMFWAAIAVTAGMFIRVLGDPFGEATLSVYLGVIALLASSAFYRMASRRPAPKGAGDGSGPAVLLELMRRFAEDPAPDVETWIAFTGCGHADQGGMRNFLDLHRDSLKDPVLVIHLDSPGRSPLIASTAEGPVFAQAHMPTGPALVERLRWAGVDLPETRLYAATDARAARVRGVRSLCLTGGDGDPTPEAAAQATDLVEVMIRWFAEDVAQVAGDRPRLEALGKALQTMRAEARRGRRRRREEAS